MARQIDVLPGEPIESSWGNPIRDTTIQRTATEATRDVEWPIPVLGDLAFIEDLAEIQYFDGADWIAVLTVELGLGSFLLLNASNGPITAGLAIHGNLEIRKDLTMASPDGVSNGYKIAPNISDTADFGLVWRRLNNDELMVLGPGGDLKLSSPVSSGMRNVHQGTTDPDPGDGIDGDVWLTYS